MLAIPARPESFCVDDTHTFWTCKTHVTYSTLLSNLLPCSRNSRKSFTSFAQSSLSWATRAMQWSISIINVGCWAYHRAGSGRDWWYQPGSGQFIGQHVLSNVVSLPYARSSRMIKVCGSIYLYVQVFHLNMKDIITHEPLLVAKQPFRGRKCKAYLWIWTLVSYSLLQDHGQRRSSVWRVHTLHQILFIFISWLLSLSAQLHDEFSKNPYQMRISRIEEIRAIENSRFDP